MLCLFQVFAQKTDTVFWADATNIGDLNGIKEIVISINDSSFKTIKYRQGKITSIEYTGIINNCLTSIEKDTIFEKNGKGIKAIIRNEVLSLDNGSNCDSLLLVKHIKYYEKGLLVEEIALKRLGEFADCPCGTWKYYENNKLTHIEEFDFCYNSRLSNLTLIETVWSPDKQFKLELYKQQMQFAMPGQGSDHLATIILKDKDNKTLKYISSNSIESIMYRDIHIEWEMTKKRVWYGRSRLFDLK